SYRSITDDLEENTYRNNQINIHSRGKLVIPVVVHVIHRPGDTQIGSPTNPDVSSIEDGLSRLNQAFSNQGPYAGGPFYSNVTQLGIQAVDTEIEFCLAQVAPDGSPHSGITRTGDPLSDVDFNRQVSTTATEDHLLKGLSFWDSNDYLNLWLVNEICEFPNTNCNLRGYAYLPGAHGSALDGIVLEQDHWNNNPDQTAVAAYYFARYLNLWRTSFKDINRPDCDNENCANRGDRVCDTPPDQSLGGPSCGLIMNSCDSDSAHQDASLNPFTHFDANDLYENFMDLGPGTGCKNTFTEGQKNRMRNALLTTRQSLLAQDRCTAPFAAMKVVAWESPAVIDCQTGIIPSLRMRNSGTLPITDCRATVTLDGTAENISWQGNVLPGEDILLTPTPTNLSKGLHSFSTEIVELNATLVDQASHPKHTYDFLISGGQEVAETSSLCHDFDAQSIPTNWAAANLSPLVSTRFTETAACSQAGKYSLRVGMESSNPNANQAFSWLSVEGPVIDPVIARMEKLQFNWAHHPTDNVGAVQLLVLAVPVDDCGLGVDTLWKADAQAMQTDTDPLNTSLQNWIPESCDDWQEKQISLQSLDNAKRRIVFAFGFTEDYEAPVFVDNICWEGRRSCPADWEIPTQAGSYQGSYLCEGEDGWLHIFKDATLPPVSNTDQLLFSIQPPQGSALDLPVSAMHVLINQTAWDVSQAPYVESQSGFYNSGRSIQLDSSLHFSGEGFKLRFYFTQQTFDALNSAIGSANMIGPEMMVPHFVREGVDGRPENGQLNVDSLAFQEILPWANDLENGWQMEGMDHYFQGEVSLTKLSYMGLGSDGQGKGYGARYPLPFTSFIGEQVGTNHVLNWEMKREIQASFYQIMHSTDGIEFLPLERVEARGIDAPRWAPTAYQFTHQNPEVGLHYYALVFNHQDGLEILSDTIKVEYSLQNLVRAYPNPVRDELTLKPSFEWEGAVELLLFDSKHQIFLQKSWPEAREYISTPIPDLPPGIYFYQLNTAEVSVQGKILKTP
ncbi:MAG: hypothetical protein AAF206_10670, partial [Bacteroidota bacterium]